MNSQRIIKKYPNRRLYDTTISAYVTVEDVRLLVVHGEPFEVHDAKTGADLTRQVLLQIITEREESGQPLLSTQLLQQLIRFYGDQMQGFMSSYLDKSLQHFLDQQQQFRSQLNHLIGQSPFSVLQTVAERNLDLLKNIQSNLFTRVPNPKEASGTNEPYAAPTAVDKNEFRAPDRKSSGRVGAKSARTSKPRQP